jgi:hypothetical protein
MASAVMWQASADPRRIGSHLLWCARGRNWELSPGAKGSDRVVNFSYHFHGLRPFHAKMTIKCHVTRLALNGGVGVQLGSAQEYTPHFLIESEKWTDARPQLRPLARIATPLRRHLQNMGTFKRTSSQEPFEWLLYILTHLVSSQRRNQSTSKYLSKHGMLIIGNQLKAARALAGVDQQTLAWNSTPRESPNAGDAYPIHLTQEFGPKRY